MPHFGAEHPEVATVLNSLAQLLKATNRLAEAEPLSKRALQILQLFERDNGYQHPHLQNAQKNHQQITENINRAKKQD